MLSSCLETSCRHVELRAFGCRQQHWEPSKACDYLVKPPGRPSDSPVLSLTVSQETCERRCYLSLARLDTVKSPIILRTGHTHIRQAMCGPTLKRKIVERAAGAGRQHGRIDLRPAIWPHADWLAFACGRGAGESSHAGEGPSQTRWECEQSKSIGCHHVVISAGQLFVSPCGARDVFDGR